MPDKFILQESRIEEATWLQDHMNQAGISNLELHGELLKVGFDGLANNISMWRTGKTQIPTKWVSQLCRILCSGEADSDAVKMLRRRFPEIAGYINLPQSPKEIKTEKHDGPQHKRRHKMILYIPKNGVHKGAEFVPFKNKQGKYQGGVDRFKENIEEFDSIDQMIQRLSEDNKFKVRMAHSMDPSVAPSLIRKNSLIIQ